jgi:hypothetical protein
MHVGMPITPVTMRPVSGLVTMFLNPSLQTTSTDDYAAGHTDAHKSPVDERYGLISTSLTTSVVSRDLGFHFCKSVHTFPSAQTHWFLRESKGLYFFDDLYPTAWLGPVFFIMAVG